MLLMPFPLIAGQLQTNIGASTERSPVLGIEYVSDNSWLFGTSADFGKTDYREKSTWKNDTKTFKLYDVESRISFSLHAGYLFDSGFSIKGGVYVNRLNYGEGLTSEITDNKDSEIEINDSGVMEENTVTPMLGLGYDVNDHFSIGINQSFSSGVDKFTQFIFGIRI